jgi:GNAT superfamily N-acetyltransferase
MDYRVQAATPEDESFLKELYSDVRATEFSPLNLPEPALAQLMDMQYRAQKSGYAEQFPGAESSIVWVGPYRVGRMLVSAGAAAIHLIDIALLGPFRGHGIGSGLIEGLCRRALEADVPVRLTVRTNNPAMNLYQRLGFIPRSQTAIDIDMEWGGPPCEVSGEQATIEAGPAAQPGLTGSYFRSIRGARALHYGAAEPVVLRLASVRTLNADPDASVSLGDSFSLTFEGNSDAMLPQGIHELEFEDGYRAEIFLVPVAAANGTATYESIFNRMQR